jgi:hypothetical protein
MPTDDEIRAMLVRRGGGVRTEGLVDDARLLALAVGRGPLERLGLRRIPVAAFAWLLVAAVAIGSLVYSQRNLPTMSTASNLPTTAPGSPASLGASSGVTQTSRPSDGTLTCQLDANMCSKVFAMAQALDPAAFDADARVVVGPRCGPNQFCTFGYHAVVIAAHEGWLHRSDLHIFQVDGVQGPETAKEAPRDATVPAHLVQMLPPTAVPGPSSPVTWSVGELLVRPLPQQPVDLVTSGWLSVTPPLPCLAQALPSGARDFRCDEQDWLTDKKFLPWSNGRAREPKTGIRVPNGSYKRFSGTPGEIDGVPQPSSGAWVVRISTGSSCEFQDGMRSCLGHPVLIVEVLERIS